MRDERMVVVSGPLQGKIFVLKGSLTLGRNPDSGIHLDDLQVSRKHAVIEQRPNGTFVRDLGSGNGTYIGDRRVIEYKLSPGDEIRIGAQQLRFEADTPAPKKESPMDGSDGAVRFKSEILENVKATDAENVFATFFQAPQKGATEEQLRETQERLQAIYTANQIITSETNLFKLFERVMDQIFSLIPAHNGVILLQEKGAEELITACVKSGSHNKEVTISSSIVRRAFEQGEAVITFDAADDSRFEAGMSIISQNISSAMCVPLTHQKERLGVIYVDTRGTTNAFVNSDLELLVALAGPAAVAIKNAQYVLMLEQAYSDTLIVLANAIELRDHYTVGHTWRVTNFSLELCKELGWDEEKLKEVRMGGVLHDVGKIAVDDAVLRKPGNLTDEEYAKIKIHPEKGAQLLQDVSFLHPLIPYCLYHHERFDGKGYPYGLAGEDIPIEGRAVAVADTFDALTSNRPYRKGFDPEKAIGIIIEGRGTQFDPDCADAMVRAYRKGNINRILQDYYKKDEKSVACPFCSTFIRLPDGVKVDDEFSCGVCHRGMRLKEANNAWYGELLPQNVAVHLTPVMNQYDTV